MNRIKISCGQIAVFAELNDSPTARAIWDALPVEARARTWGEEIYFPIPVKCALEKTAREVVQIGELGYWPPGTAFCIFFGPTPISRPGEIRAASAVNIVGKVIGDVSGFKHVSDDEIVVVTKD